MKKFVAFTAAVLLASAAQAVTWTSVSGAPDQGPASGESILVSFDAPLPTGYALSGSYAIVSGTTSAAAMPANDATKYFYVSSNLGNGIAKLTTPDLNALSFYWGSVDRYNSVDVLGAGGATLLTLAGSALPVATGNQFIASTNRRVFFTAGANEVITGLRFRSTGVAFELDSIAGAAVPEPASWALMIVGFGLVGAALRRRATQTVVRVNA
ncbi:MAG: PEPxxWA-CTERM sorting domain-containing protein [Polymorphobacter sp.]